MAEAVGGPPLIVTVRHREGELVWWKMIASRKVCDDERLLIGLRGGNKSFQFHYQLAIDGLLTAREISQSTASQ